MRTYIYIFISIVFLLLFSSCVKEEEDIFSESAIVRLNSTIKKHREILQDAPNGWLMQYFPTIESEGYNLMTNFKESGETTVACWTDITVSNSYEEYTSTFNVIGDYGPVLSYDLYNDVLNMFSDPAINPIGTGFGGDYEFQIISSNENEVILKGKKTETPIRMIKCPDDITWSDYLEGLDALDKSLFISDNQLLSFRVGENMYNATGGKSHIFSLLKAGYDEHNVVPRRFPFIITETGIRFVLPFKIDGYQVQDFDLNEDKSMLVSRDNKSVYFSGPDLEYYFYNTRTTWNLNEELMSPDTRAVYDNFVSYCKNYPLFKATKVACAIDRVDKGFNLKITLMKGKDRFNLNLDMNIETDEAGHVKIDISGTGDANGVSFYKNSVELRNFIQLISGKIKISSDNGLNPSVLKLINAENTNHWLYISENIK